MDYDSNILGTIVKMYDLQNINPNVKISSKKLYKEIKSVSEFNSLNSRFIFKLIINGY